MGVKFEILATPFESAKLLVPTRWQDERGFFSEIYQAQDFEALGIPDKFVQCNHSHSSRGVLRGLHFQTPPHAISKLVYCVSGEIWDVIVDVRPESKTHGQWFGATLSAQNHNMLYVPKGFAHGFCVISQTADVLYQQDGVYAPSHDAGIRYDDPDIGIPWPSQQLIVSAKDQNLPTLVQYQAS